MPERFITVQDAAEQLQVHPQTVRVWLREGKLRGIERLLSPSPYEAPRSDEPLECGVREARPRSS